jgi:hypothetical protein
MVVFLFRPSPQVPRPSLNAANKCYDACKFNIRMQREQIETGSVDLTWIFTQSIFMAINTILWSLSYSEIRRLHPREEVEEYLSIGLEAIQLASERWPGVLSALELYRNLIDACMKIYDKDGDVPISASSPSDTSIRGNSVVEDSTRSRTASPATMSAPSVTTPNDRNQPPFGFISHISQQHQPYQPQTSPTTTASHFYAETSPVTTSRGLSATVSPEPFNGVDPITKVPSVMPGTTQQNAFDPTVYSNPLPSTFPDLVNWNPSFNIPPNSPPSTLPPITSPGYTSPQQSYQQHQNPFAAGFPQSPPPLQHQPNSFSTAAHTGFPIAGTEYLYEQSWGMDRPGMGLNADQAAELMHSLETEETDRIEKMIQQGSVLFGRPG